MAVEKRFRVAEIFGPTIQGEGRHAGSPCYFIRFGGCDFRCRWCDTPHAVLPDQVAKLPQLTITEIYDTLDRLDGDPNWVVLSGGNPALLDLRDLIYLLQKADYKVMVETQGTTWQDWLLDCDEVCISPKPPSSGTKGFEAEFLLSAMQAPRRFYLKIVVFDEQDYYWAREMHNLWRKFDFFLSVGNEDPSLPTVSNPYPQISGTVDDTRIEVLDQTKWLFEKVAGDAMMADVRVIPQLHTLAWGNQRGR